MGENLIVGARESSLISKIVSSLSIFALVLTMVAPAIVNAAPGGYQMDQNPTITINDLRVELSGDASADPYVGSFNAQTVSVDWDEDGNGQLDNASCVSLKDGIDSNDSVTTVTHTSGTKFWDLTWTAGHDYTTPGVYNILVAIHHSTCSGAESSGPAVVDLTVTVVIPNSPVASDLPVSTNEDTAVSDSVTATDGDGDTLTYSLVAGPTNGTLTSSINSSTGAFTYTPNANFTGTDTFTFKANDGTNDSNTATVTITVNPVNDAPVANDGFITVDEDTPISSTLTSSDIDGVSTTYVVVAGPANGVISGFNASTGDFTYTPNSNYNGSDSFTFRVNDGAANSNDATISITVNPVDDAPVALDDVYSVGEDTSLTVGFAAGVLANDVEVEGDSLTAVSFSSPSSGTLTTDVDGSFLFTPDANFSGSVTFTYKANDGSNNSNTATVTINVSNPNDSPVAAADSYITDEDTALNIAAPGVLSNDTDGDANTLNAVLVSDVSNGTLDLDSDGSFDYTPNANFNGSDSFTYKANDGTSDSSTVTVTITVNPVNDAPVVSDDSNTTPKNQSFIDNVSGTDTDGDLLTYSVVDDVQNGALTLNADGSFTYTPDTDYVGSDSFTFKADDGPVDSNTATFTITVTALPTHTLTVTTNGEGDGVVNSNDGKISCDSELTEGQETGTDCTETYEEGTVLTLTATPDEGSNFDSSWSGACSGSAPCTLTITGPTTVNAHFAKNAVVTPPPAGGGGGGGGGVFIPPGGLVIPGSTSGAGAVLGASTGPTGAVLGDSTCTPHFSKHLLNGYGTHDTWTVTELQKFLNEYMNAGLEITGAYDTATVKAVRAFQDKEFAQVITPWGIKKNTGHFYLTTLRMANIRYCELHGDVSLSIAMPALIPFKKGTVAGATTAR